LFKQTLENTEGTIQRNWQHLAQDEGTIQRNWQHLAQDEGTIQRNWQHLAQDEEKNKKHNTICAGHHYTKQKLITQIRHEPSYQQPEVKTNIVLCRNRSGYHNTELRT
jgi:hypothetical protein